MFKHKDLHLQNVGIWAAHMGTSASKRPSKTLNFTCGNAPTAFVSGTYNIHIYIYIYNYAEKHMALSQLFSREKPKQKSHGFKSRFPHENGRFTVSPSGKSPSFTQVSPGHRLGSFQFLHHARDHLLTCPQDGSWGSHLSIIHMRTMVLEYESKHLPPKSPSFVGKYTSTMEHLGNEW